MDRHSIIEYLRAERDILTGALEALEGAFTTLRGKPSGKTRRQHRLTPEGRRRLSIMMKGRWAERRKRSTGSAARKTGKGQLRRRANRLTPAGRRKLSLMMKKRWAERKKKAA
jgi:hypothetical protein